MSELCRRRWIWRIQSACSCRSLSKSASRRFLLVTLDHFHPNLLSEPPQPKDMHLMFLLFNASSLRGYLFLVCFKLCGFAVEGIPEYLISAWAHSCQPYHLSRLSSPSIILALNDSVGHVPDPNSAKWTPHLSVPVEKEDRRLNYHSQILLS